MTTETYRLNDTGRFYIELLNEFATVNKSESNKRIANKLLDEYRIMQSGINGVYMDKFIALMKDIREFVGA